MFFLARNFISFFTYNIILFSIILGGKLIDIIIGRMKSMEFHVNIQAPEFDIVIRFHYITCI